MLEVHNSKPYSDFANQRGLSHTTSLLYCNQSKGKHKENSFNYKKNIIILKIIDSELEKYT